MFGEWPIFSDGPFYPSVPKWPIHGFSSPMWILETTCKPANVQCHLFSSPMWVEKITCSLALVQYHFILSCVNPKPFMGLQLCNIIFFFAFVNLKNHLWVNKCATSFLSSHMWIKKTICEFVNVQYHFIFFCVNPKSHLWVCKYAMCNIIFFFTCVN